MFLPVRHCLAALAAVVLTVLATGATADPGDSAPRADDPAETSTQWGWE